MIPLLRAHVHKCMCVLGLPVSLITLCLRMFFSVPVSQVREYWLGYELEMVNYQNKCRLIKGWDDLFNKCKEHINQVVAMKLSPYFKVCTAVVMHHAVARHAIVHLGQMLSIAV